MYLTANGSISDYFAKLSYCRLREKLSIVTVFSPTNTVPKKSSSASPEITHYYFDHFYPSLARSTITRIVFERYVGGRQQANHKRNLCTTEQRKHISLPFFPSSSRSFCVILWCDSSLPFYVFWAVNKKDTVSLIC